MRGALLWKRILNEGIKTYSEAPDALGPAIIIAPIIVDSRPFIPHLIKTGHADGLEFPFNRIWIEGPLATSVEPNATSRWGTFIQAERSDENSNWMVMISGILGKTSEQPLYVGSYRFVADPNGTMIKESRQFVVDLEVSRRNGEEKVKESCRIFCGLACDTLSLLGCKNISLKTNDNDPQQVGRAIKRHGGTPESYRYHTLVVRPPGSKPGTPGQDIGIMPRHVCRGHFSEYGHEFNKGLLFGKYSGRFYIPPHVKGDKKNGIVEKDYVIQQAEGVPNVATDTR
jgi:hypothetical protein